MRISTSPDFLQAVMDDERVSRWVSQDGDGHAELASIWGEMLGLEFDTGGFLFHDLGDGVREVHTLFLPKSVGVEACAEQALSHVFCQTGCMRVVTKVPAINRAARRLAEGAGFRLDYTIPDGWRSRGKRYDLHVLSLDFDSWANRHGYRQVISLVEPEKARRALYRWAVVNLDLSILE
ncbi:GNAT family N-acetyltransferase [Luteimonas sp. RIT-PG2_3]